MHLLVQMPIRTKPKLDAMQEKSEKQWLRELHDVEATIQQYGAINKTMKGRRRRFKPSGRAVLEQVQDRIGTCKKSQGMA